MGLIREMLDRHSPAMIEVVAEPGYGKTALLNVAVAHARTIGLQIIRMGTTEVESGVPWSAMAGFVQGVPSTLRDELPDVQRNAVAAALGEAHAEQHSMGSFVAAALRSLLQSTAARGPVLLAIDDAHWMDAASAGAISVALRSIEDQPVVVVATSRPVAEPVLDLARLAPDLHLRLQLAPLTGPEVSEVLRQRGMLPGPDVLLRIRELSGGNPLHVTLLAEHLLTPESADSPLPPSILRGYRELIDRLDPFTVQVLELAAVHGRPEPEVLVAALATTGAEDDAIARALIAAERAGLVTEDGDGPAFTHPMVTAAILQRLGPLATAEMHRTLADVSNDELRSVHLAAATTGTDAEVAAALDRAAQLSLARGASQVAGERFERALQLTPDHERGDVFRRAVAAGNAYLAAGAVDRGLVVSRRAYEMADNPFEIAIAGGVLAQVMAGRDFLATLDFLDEVLDRLRGQPMLRSFLGRARVRAEQVLSMPHALEMAMQFRDEMSASGLQPLADEFEVVVENCRFGVGEPTDPLRVWELSKAGVDTSDILGAAWLALELLVWCGDQPDAATHALDLFEQAAAAKGDLMALAKVYDFRANHAIRQGQWAVGEIEMRKAVDAAELSDLPGAMAHNGLAWILGAMGRIDESTASIGKYRAVDASDETPLFRMSHCSCHGFVQLCAGNHEAAVDLLTQAWVAADKVGMGDLTAMPFRADLVEALASLGRFREARERADVVMSLARRSGIPGALSQGHRALASALLGEGHVTEAIEEAERGLDLHRGLDVPFEQGRLYLVLGTALRRAGRRQDAAVALTSASKIFASLGAAPFAARADAEIARLGQRGTPNELTATESKVAALVAMGRSNAEVAAELVVSLRTVESHLTRIYRKLGVRSRAELAAGYRDRL